MIIVYLIMKYQKLQKKFVAFFLSRIVRKEWESGRVVEQDTKRREGGMSETRHKPNLPEIVRDYTRKSSLKHMHAEDVIVGV